MASFLMREGLQGPSRLFQDKWGTIRGLFSDGNIYIVGSLNTGTYTRPLHSLLNASEVESLLRDGSVLELPVDALYDVGL